MRTLPTEMIRVLAPFALVFSKSVWQNARILLTGAILAPGKRTVASALRAVGLQEERRFCRYHRVLSRAVWSSREASRVLLGLLVEAFVPEGGPLVVGIDETLERRRGKKISAKGIYSGPGALQPRALRQNQCSQMGVPDAFGAGPLGLSGMVLAVLECPGLL
jgi:hypothetical protein